jgi:serine/threonine protein kinase
MAVRLVKSRRSGRLYVEKRVRTQGNNYLCAKNELAALRRFGCTSRNLNYMVNTWQTPSHLTFILEYCDGGNLADFVYKRAKEGRTFSSEHLCHVLASVAKGLAFMHQGLVSDGNGGMRSVSSNW